MRKRLMISGLALALLLATVSPAWAERIRGTGELHAWGDGIAAVRGNVEVTITGNGTLFIRDSDGDGEWTASGSGERRDLPNGWSVYYGFNGTVEAQGSRITVLLSGYDIDLRAEGTGGALLFGEGGYETKHGDNPWSDELPWSSEVQP